jgi:hypothetical protein
MIDFCECTRDGRKISYRNLSSAGNGMNEIHTDVGGTGIIRLNFNIVPTDIDAFVPQLQELEYPLLVKVGVLGPYGCFSVFIGGETAPFECPTQNREEVKVTWGQVGTVGGVVQALPTEGGNMVDRCCCRVGSCIVVQKNDSRCEKARSLPHFLLCPRLQYMSFRHACRARTNPLSSF